MTTKHTKALTAVAIVGLLAGAGAAYADTIPAGYPADYAKIIEQGKAEGKVSIFTSTDIEQAQSLIDGFKAAYPGIEIEYNDLGTNGSYNRVISEAAANQVSGDIIWTSAMDQQMVLVRDGLTDAYASPEIAKLPSWGSYKDSIYATTIEPAAILFNNTQVKKEDVPTTRAGLISYLQQNKDALSGRVATFDPEKSGTGFLYSTNEVRTWPEFWDYAKAFGVAKGKVYSSSGNMRETVVSGENVMAFNVIGSYALDWAKDNPSLGVVFLSDYTQAFSRTASILKDAPHPNAARLFVDYLLSPAGQKALAENGMPSIRDDVEGVVNAKSLNETVGGNLQPIKLDEQLLEFMDPEKRVGFFKEWKSATIQ